jgi:type I restriction enzyme S subunit
MSVEVPEGWHVQSMNEFSEVVSGSTPDTSNSRYWNGDIIWITPDDLSKNEQVYVNESARRISNLGLRNSSAQIIPRNSIVMSSRAPIGYLAIVTSDYTTNQGCKSLRLRNSVTPEFVYYALLFNMDKIKQKGEGTTFAEISKKELEGVSILLPKSLPEQKKIASILQCVGNAIGKTKELIEKHKKMKQGLMQDLFSKDGLISIEFNEVIDEILDFRGKTPRKLGMEWGKGDILALSANNVKMGYIDPNTEAYYASEKLYRKWMNRGKPEKGDILLTMEAPLGNVAQIPDDRKYILSQRVILIKPSKEKVENDYLAHFLRSDFFQKQLMEFSSGTTAIGIQQAKLVKLTILYPERKEEQKEIATVLTMMDNTINSQESCLSKLVKMKAGLMQDLLTGKVRVAA